MRTTEWEVVRHHVSICGRVLDGEGHPQPDVRLDASMDDRQRAPSEPKTPVTARRRNSERTPQESDDVFEQSSRTKSRRDGTFFFLDCPDGRYTVTAQDPRSGLRDQKSVSVTRKALEKKTKDRGIEEGYQVELVLGGQAKG